VLGGGGGGGGSDWAGDLAGGAAGYELSKADAHAGPRLIGNPQSSLPDIVFQPRSWPPDPRLFVFRFPFLSFFVFLSSCFSSSSCPPPPPISPPFLLLIHSSPSSPSYFSLLFLTPIFFMFLVRFLRINFFPPMLGKSTKNIFPPSFGPGFWTDPMLIPRDMVVLCF